MKLQGLIAEEVIIIEFIQYQSFQINSILEELFFIRVLDNAIYKDLVSRVIFFENHLQCY